MSQKQTIEQVKKDWEGRLMATPGVTGVGIGLTKDRRQKALPFEPGRVDAEQGDRSAVADDAQVQVGDRRLEAVDDRGREVAAVGAEQGHRAEAPGADQRLVVGHDPLGNREHRGDAGRL